MAQPDQGRRRMWRFRLDESTILEVFAPGGATEKQVRRRGRVSLVLVTLVTTLALAAVASGTDQLVADGVISTTPVSSQALAFGEVCPGASYPSPAAENVALAILRGNNTTNAFDNNAVVALSLQATPYTLNQTSANGTLGATIASPGTITLPADWTTNGTISSSLGSSVTLTVPAGATPGGPYTGAVNYRATGDKQNDTQDLTRPHSLSVSWTVLSASNPLCAPSNEAPTVAAGGPYNGAEGSDISIDGASASDPDSDPLTYSWAKDESGIVDGGSCTLANPTTLSPTLNCDDNGSVTLTLTVDDGNGHTPSAQATVDVTNADPSATPGIPDSDVNEGDSFELSLSSPTDSGSNDTHTYQFDCGDGGGYSAASTTASRSCPTTDNGSRSVSLKILDDDGGFAEYPGTVTVVNVDPTVAAASFQVAAIGCRTSVTLSRIGFNDPGADADWTVEIDWDDGSTTSYDTASKGVQPVQTHQYDTPGTYTATVRVTDKDGGVGSNASSNSLAVDQTYTVDFLPPFDDSTPSGLIVNKMKNGRVVPVKATVYDDCALSFVTDPDADVTIRTSKTSGTGVGDPVEEYADAGESSGGTDAFRWSDDGFWIYNLDSKALGLVVNNLYRVDIYVGGIQATVSNWAVLQPVK